MIHAGRRHEDFTPGMYKLLCSLRAKAKPSFLQVFPTCIVCFHRWHTLSQATKDRRTFVVT